MTVKSWLSQQAHFATSIFHTGRYCEKWKASTYETGNPSFHVILDGHCWLNFTDTQQITRLESGDIVFFFFNIPFYLTSEQSINLDKVFKKEMHPVSDKREGDAALMCGFLHPKGIEAEVLFTLLPEYIIIRNNTKSKGKISQLIEMLKEESHSACELALTRITDLLLLYIIEQLIEDFLVDVNLLNVSKNSAFAKLLIEIMHNPGEEWTLDSMAKKTSMSRSTFIRKLDCLCGLSSNEFLTKLRINIAVNLLRRGYTSESVAFKVGYKSITGFYKAFKKTTLKTPTNFWRGDIEEQIIRQLK